MATEVNQETLVNLKTALGSTTAIPTSPGPGGSATGTVSRTAVTTNNTTLKAANTSRRGLTIYNNSPGGSKLYVKLGATAVITAGSESFTIRMDPFTYFEVPAGYTGIVDGIWDAADANGEALVTELT